MKWIEILRKNDYALLQSETDTQYAVVVGYNPSEKEDEQWSYGYYFLYDVECKAEQLMCATDLFLDMTEANHITRERLEYLAESFVDKLYDTGITREELEEFFRDECDMEEYEKKFFGIQGK